MGGPNIGREPSLLPPWEIVSLADYRLRYATYHNDEGLRNLRRRAPMVSSWDDHEFANNAYGNGTIEGTGAKGHQPICEEGDSMCTRDEGPVEDRLRAATQAYLEWLPIRPSQGPMGIIENVDITQTVEWGDLASFVAVDTRVSRRSREPTLLHESGSTGLWTLENFVPFCSANLNTSAYAEPPLDDELFAVKETILAVMNDPEFTQISEEQKDFIIDTFSNSKAAGKPWQVFLSPTMMGPLSAADLDTLHEFAPTEEGKAAVKANVNLFASLTVVVRTAIALGKSPGPL